MGKKSLGSLQYRINLSQRAPFLQIQNLDKIMALSPLLTPKLFRSLYTSSSFSSPCSSHHKLHHTQLSLQTLLKSGFTPTLQDLNNHLLFLLKIHRFKHILNFYDQMSSNHIEGDSQTHSILTLALLKSHNFEGAYHFLKTHMVKSLNSPKNRIWDSLIRGLCTDQNDPEKALSVLKDGLNHYGILPSSFTFRSLIHCFSSKGEMDRAIQVLELMSDEKFKYPFDNFVCSSVVSGFCKMGEPELALEFVENAKKAGALRPNVVTYTALVSALCELGRIKEVDILVCKMEKAGLVFDVVFYSSWILGYLKLGILEDAFRKYRQMLENRIKPDNISYTVLIDGFSKEGNVEKSVGFLEKMKKDGLEPNLVTYTAIIFGFCKKGKLEEALAIFKMIEGFGICVDEFTYATLIDGACRRGDFDCVFYLLEDMERNGLSPSIVTYNTVINGLCKVGRTSEADDISRDVVGDVITYSTLLHGYIEEENVTGMLETKKRLEEAGVSMDVVMCNILVKALFMVGAFEDAYTIYKEMPKMNLIADSVTYCTMVKGYCKVGRIDKALEIFDEFRRTSISSDACYTCIIHGLCRTNMVGMAIEVFSELNDKGLVLDVGTYRMLIKAIFEEHGSEGVINIVNRIENLEPEMYDIVCNDAISFLCKRGFFETACNVYMTMRMKGSITTSKSYYNILKGLLGKGKEWLNLPILNTFIKEHGLVEGRVNNILVRYLCMKDVDNAILFLRNIKSTSTVTIPVTVLKALTEDGRALDAYNLVVGAEDNLSIMNVAGYSNLVDGLCKGGHLNKALDLCAFVQKKGINLNIITYNSVLHGLCRQGHLVEALRIFDSIGRVGLVPSEVTYAILADALCKEGFLQDAKELFDRMVFKGLNLNTRIYNSLINGYCKFGQMNEALKLLHDLEIRCLKPDGFTVSAMIHGYFLKGDMEGALDFFFEFKRKGTLPDFLGFLNLIRGLCAKGRMEEARSVLREMLQTSSILDLINQVDAEVQTESLESFLIFLCEQGSIKEAITILDEVRCMVLPVGKSLSSYKSQKSKEVIGEDNLGNATSTMPISTTDKTDMDWLCNAKEMGKVVKSCGNLAKRSQLHDFNVYYSVIASFCSKGELQKANKLVKDVLLPFNKKFQ